MEELSSCSKVMCILLRAATKYIICEKRKERTNALFCIALAHNGVAITYLDLLIQYGFQKIGFKVNLQFHQRQLEIQFLLAPHLTTPLRVGVMMP
jgi:hypothetical protein